MNMQSLAMVDFLHKSGDFLKPLVFIAHHEAEDLTEEFRREAFRLSYESGRSVPDLAEDLGIGKSTLNPWRRRYRDIDGKQQITGPDEDELIRLRREVRILRQERDILKKATAFSPSREVNEIPFYCLGETTLPRPHVMPFARGE